MFSLLFNNIFQDILTMLCLIEYTKRHLLSIPCNYHGKKLKDRAQPRTSWTFFLSHFALQTWFDLSCFPLLQDLTWMYWGEPFAILVGPLKYRYKPKLVSNNSSTLQIFFSESQKHSSGPGLVFLQSRQFVCFAHSQHGSLAFSPQSISTLTSTDLPSA